MYLSGQVVAADSREAAKWFTKSADRSVREAAYELRVLSFTGNGVPQDYRAAAAWFRKSAHQDYLDAEYALAQMWLRGLGVEKDTVVALAWADAAVATAKHAPGMYRSKVGALRTAIVADMSPEQVAAASILSSPDAPARAGVARDRAAFERSITYPRGMRYLDKEGIVVVFALVNAEGHVTSIVVEASSGYPQLASSVLKALAHAEFEPKRVGRQPMESWQVLKFEFQLR